MQQQGQGAPEAAWGWARAERAEEFTYCLGSSREVGGGFQVSGWPSIQSDQTFTLGSNSFRSWGKAETLMSSSATSCSGSCSSSWG